MLMPSKISGFVVDVVMLGVACPAFDVKVGAVVAVPAAPIVALVALLVVVVVDKEALAPVEGVGWVLLPWDSRSMATGTLGV